jgi:hypothetical protein
MSVEFVPALRLNSLEIGDVKVEAGDTVVGH